MKHRVTGLGLIAALLLGGAASGCASTMLVDTQTVHNREATRIWIVRRRTGTVSRDEVVYCDATMAQSSGQLCQRWE